MTMAHKSPVFAAFMAAFLFLFAPSANSASAPNVCRSVPDVVASLQDKYPGVIIIDEDPNDYISTLSELAGGQIDVPDGLIVVYMEGEGTVVLIGFIKGCAAGAIPIPRSVHEIVLKKIEKSRA